MLKRILKKLLPIRKGLSLKRICRSREKRFNSLLSDERAIYEKTSIDFKNAADYFMKKKKYRKVIQALNKVRAAESYMVFSEKDLMTKIVPIEETIALRIVALIKVGRKKEAEILLQQTREELGALPSIVLKRSAILREFGYTKQAEDLLAETRKKLPDKDSTKLLINKKLKKLCSKHGVPLKKL